MRSNRGFLFFAGLIIFYSSTCYGATITGMVKGPDSKPFQGAFVEVQNMKTRITVAVLSDAQGHYRIDNLSTGEYRLLIRAVGYRVDPLVGVNLIHDASFDFALQEGVVHWSDISLYQATQLWPASKGKQLILAKCSICHQFQSRMASVTRDEDGWRGRVDYMRSAMHFSLSLYDLTDEDANVIASYLASLFGPDSLLPKSPADMPEYTKTVRPFSSGAMNIVYVEYDMPGPSRMPFSAAPDRDGNIWIPNSGPANKITRLNPKTGEMDDFSVPNIGTAAIHSAVPALDGSVWVAEQGSNKLGRWDPNSQKITEYQDAYRPGQEGIDEGGEKHTIRLDLNGNVWTSGAPLTKFDPETRKFTRFEEVAHAYDVKPDKGGNIWFTSPRVNKIGKVDGKTLKVTTWTVTTADAYPRRLEIAADGMIWFGEFNAGKMGRFDPRTQTVKEYPLPGPDPSPYALGIDSEGYIWYDSHTMDVMGRFDPKTGNVIEYPFPQPELSMREFFRDAQGRMWFGTNPNNKVGYFFLAK